MMEGPEEQKPRGKRRQPGNNGRVVVRVEGGGGGLLLLGGALAAAVALGTVGFVVRAVGKKKKKTTAAAGKGSPREGEQERSGGGTTTSGGDGRGEEGEDREGFRSLVLLASQASPPSPHGTTSSSEGRQGEGEHREGLCCLILIPPPEASPPSLHSSTPGSEGRGEEEKEDGEGLRSLVLLPPPQVSPPSPPPLPPRLANDTDVAPLPEKEGEPDRLVGQGKEENPISSKHEPSPICHNSSPVSASGPNYFPVVGDEDAIVQEPNVVQAQEKKVTEKGTAIDDERGKSSGADGLPATGDDDAIVREPNSVRPQEKKVTVETTANGGSRERAVEEVLPAIINEGIVVVDESKIMRLVEQVPLQETPSTDGFAGESKGGAAAAPVEVVEQSKIIQVVEQVPLQETTSTDGSAGESKQEDVAAPVGEGTEEVSTDDTGDSPTGPDAAEVMWAAKAIAPTSGSPGIHKSESKAMTAGEVFRGATEKLGAAELAAPGKEKSGGEAAVIGVEMRETWLSENAQKLLLLSTLLFVTVAAVLLHHCSSKLVESGSRHL